MLNSVTATSRTALWISSLSTPQTNHAHAFIVASFLDWPQMYVQANIMTVGFAFFIKNHKLSPWNWYAIRDMRRDEIEFKMLIILSWVAVPVMDVPAAVCVCEKAFFQLKQGYRFFYWKKRIKCNNRAWVVKLLMALPEGKDEESNKTNPQHAS